jgi:CspA family cold shock protein
MAKGKVKWYNRTKGFGFIETESGEDVFVHRSGLKNSFSDLDTDQEVEFETQNGEKGIMAIDVEVIN